LCCRYSTPTYFSMASRGLHCGNHLRRNFNLISFADRRLGAHPGGRPQWRGKGCNRKHCGPAERLRLPTADLRESRLRISAERFTGPAVCRDGLPNPLGEPRNELQARIDESGQRLNRVPRIVSDANSSQPRMSQGGVVRGDEQC
jgi:hypothetical protein